MKKYLVIAAVLGALAVILGAFGAHGLKGKITPELLQSFETAVRYQMYHVMVLLLINNMSQLDKYAQKVVSILFVLGILFFSGSIYAITFGIPAKLIWFITPLGGVLFVIGWLFLAYSFFKKHKNDYY